MIIDGKKIALDIKENIKKEIGEKGLDLSVVTIVVGLNEVIEKFVSLKKKFAEDIGICFEIRRFDKNIDQDSLEKEIKKISKREDTNGIIVQLPLPDNINTQKILDLIPEDKDIDVLSNLSNKQVLHPVVGSIKEILERSNLEVKSKKAMVIGKGKLVGKPVANWLKSCGAEVSSYGRDDTGLKEDLSDADIVVSGVGKANLITKDMLKKDVVLLDAGSSEQGGVIVGDCSADCEQKAKVFSKSPGGIGPITIAVLFKNLLELNR